MIGCKELWRSLLTPLSAGIFRHSHIPTAPDVYFVSFSDQLFYIIRDLFMLLVSSWNNYLVHTRAFLDNRDGLRESAKKYALYSWRDFQKAKQFIQVYKRTIEH